MSGLIALSIKNHHPSKAKRYDILAKIIDKVRENNDAQQAVEFLLAAASKVPERHQIRLECQQALEAIFKKMEVTLAFQLASQFPMSEILQDSLTPSLDFTSASPRAEFVKSFLENKSANQKWREYLTFMIVNFINGTSTSLEDVLNNPIVDTVMCTPIKALLKRLVSSSWLFGLLGE